MPVFGNSNSKEVNDRYRGYWYFNDKFKLPFT